MKDKFLFLALLYLWLSLFVVAGFYGTFKDTVKNKVLVACCAGGLSSVLIFGIVKLCRMSEGQFEEWLNLRSNKQGK